MRSAKQHDSKPSAKEFLDQIGGLAESLFSVEIKQNLPSALLFPRHKNLPKLTTSLLNCE